MPRKTQGTLFLPLASLIPDLIPPDAAELALPQ
jgi:hypothetical protein